jgi:hypothetical protein
LVESDVPSRDFAVALSGFCTKALNGLQATLTDPATG